MHSFQMHCSEKIADPQQLATVICMVTVGNEKLKPGNDVQFAVSYQRLRTGPAWQAMCTVRDRYRYGLLASAIVDESDVNWPQESLVHDS